MRRPTVKWPILLVLLCFGAVDAEAAKKARSQMEFGVQMAREGLWREALFRFQQARREGGDSGKLLNNIAVSYEALGEFERALETYREALQTAPGNRELRQNYSRFLEFYQAYSPQAGDGEAAAGEGNDDG